MNAGKTLFAQLMDFLPWTTFGRYVTRYGGGKGIRTLSCAEQFRVMAFAQLSYRESLGDIETCLSAQAAKLYHMGFREPVRRSTLADANESRDWRIWADFAQRLIIQARLRQRRLGAGIDEDGVCAGFDDHRPAPRPLQGSRVRQDVCLPHQSDDLAGRKHLRPLKESLAGGTVLQVDQAASSDQTVFRYVGECGQDANLDRGVGLCPGRHRQEAAQSGRLALHFATDFVGHSFREDAHPASLPGRCQQNCRELRVQPIESVHDLTGQ